MRKWIAISLMVLAAGSLAAQQDAQFSQYIFNGLVLNPAYAGSRGAVSASLFVRSQWIGMPGAPNTQSVSVHAPTKNERYGFGLSLMNDQIGYWGQKWLNGSYALRIRKEKFTVALGLQGSLHMQSMNFAKAEMIPGTDFDPILSNDRQSKVGANAGAGLYAYTRRAYVGLSVPHVFRTNVAYHSAFPPAGFPQPVLRRNLLATGGVVLGMGSSVKIKPTFLLKWTEGTMPQADLNLQALLSNRLWCGVGYRTGGTVMAMAEFQISPKLRAGYAFDYGLHPHLNGVLATHEFNLGFDLRSKADPLKNPRYF